MIPNVKYELLELERIISLANKKNTRNKADKPTLQSSVEMEVNRVKQTFIHEVFTFEDERHLERYIQYHQQALIRLMDHTAFSLNTESKDGQRSPDSIFYSSLEDLLTFVERHFTKYFDQDAKAPEGYIAIARKDAKTNARRLKKILVEKNTDPRIIELMLHVLQKIAQCGPEHGATYRKVMYVKEMQKEMFRLLERKTDIQDMDEELRQIMYYLNYNSVKVFAYHAHYITSLLEAGETRAEKLERLSLALKKVNQAQVKPDIRYNLHRGSLKEQLNSYISEEIDYLERLQQLSGNTTERPMDAFLQGFKLRFDASVTQLAYLLKILIETKIILNNNLSQVLHFLVRFVTTKRSEAVSYGSIRSKFYNVETGTKESVRKMLLSMIHHIERN